MILLDTNFLIYALKVGTAHARQVREWIADGQTVSMSVMAWAEFLCVPSRVTIAQPRKNCCQAFNRC